MSKSIWPGGVIKAAGSIIGMILTVTGSIMIINNTLQYTFFDSYSYSSFEYQCKHKNPDVAQDELVLMTEDEKQACIAKEEAKEKKRYDRNKLEGIVDGIAPLIIGIFLWSTFRARKED